MSYQDNIRHLHALVAAHQYVQAGEVAQIILPDAQSRNDKDMILMCAWAMGTMNRIKGDFDTSIQQFSDALLLVDTSSQHEIFVRLQMGLGTVYAQTNNYSKAIPLLEASRVGISDISSHQYLSVLNALGICYMYCGDYDKALPLYLEVLANCKDNTYLELIVLNNLAELLQNKKEFELAHEYYQRAIELTKQNGLTQEANYTNLAGLYLQMNRFEEALELYAQSIEISKTTQNKVVEINSLIGSAVALQKLRQFTQSIRLFEEASLYCHEKGLKRMEAHALQLQAEVFIEEDFLGKSLTKAIELTERSLQISQTIADKVAQVNNYHFLAKLYEKKEQYKEAYDHFQKATAIEKTISSEETEKLIQRNRAIFEVEQSKKEADFLRVKNNELATLNIELSELNREKNEILGIVAHDLKNPIGSIRMLARLLTAGNLTVSEVEEFSNDILSTADRMFELVTTLLDVNAIEQGQINVHIEAIEATTILSRCEEQFIQQALLKNITIESQIIEEEVFVSADKHLLQEVLDNILSNAVKYTFPGRKIVVGLDKSESFVKFWIKDEGPGLTEEDKQKLFGKYQRLSAQPTGGEHSTGLGLSIVKKMVELMHGKVWCESELGKGSTFYVELPAI